MLLTMLGYTQKLLSWVGGWWVGGLISCEIKAISAPSWGLADWLGLSLAISDGGGQA